MNLNPKWRFIIQIIGFITIGISQGTVNLTNVVPGDFVKPVVAWCGLLAFIISGITTALSGFGATTSSVIQAAAALPDVKQVVTTPTIANAAGPDGVGAKIVSK